MIDLVGLHEVARKRAGQFSLGMGQRLGIAAALLGDPHTVMLDEPVNGLDPEGIQWIRNLLRSWQREGRAVFVSSHLMSEMALTADHLIVIGRGRLIADTSVEELVRQASGDVVPRPLAAGRGAPRPHRRRRRHASSRASPGLLEVHGLTAAQIGEAAATNGIVLHELTPQQVSLEQAFMEMTRDERRVPRRRPRRRRTRHDDARRTRSRCRRSPTTGRVTQAHVVRSEWTKLHLAPLDPLVAARRRAADDRPSAALRGGHLVALGHMSPRDRARPASARHRARRREPLPARDRRARRARDHGRVLDRDDPRQPHRRPETAAGALGEARRLRGGHVRARAALGAHRVLRQPGDPLAPRHPADLALASRRRCARSSAGPST